MSNDNAFNGKLGVNMVLDSTPDTGPRVHAKENPRVSDLIDRLRLKSGTRQFLITEETALEAADALESKDKIISELVLVLTAVKDRFFPDGQGEDSQDMLWLPVHGVLSKAHSISPAKETE